LRADEERSGLVLFRSAGDLTYQPPVYHDFTEFAYGLGCADIDADGDQDAAAALRYSNRAVVCVNDGSGNFVDAFYAVGSVPLDAMLVDVNGVDGPDLITANSAANSITCRYNDGTGGFPTGTDFSVGTCPVHVIACDMDRNGRQDIVTANRSDGTVSVLLNNGQGGFPSHVEYATGLLAPVNLASGDFDGANGPDVVVVELDPNGSHHQIAVLFNDGAGIWATPYSIRHKGLSSR